MEMQKKKLQYRLTRLAEWYLKRTGHVVIDRERYDTARALLATSAEYIAKSGHLNTVRRRKPQAIYRLAQALATAASVLVPGVRTPETTNLRWGMMVPGWLRKWPRYGKAILTREEQS